MGAMPPANADISPIAARYGVPWPAGASFSPKLPVARPMPPLATPSARCMAYKAPSCQLGSCTASKNASATMHAKFAGEMPQAPQLRAG